jgi:hypothetical protein
MDAHSGGAFQGHFKGEPKFRQEDAQLEWGAGQANPPVFATSASETRNTSGLLRINGYPLSYSPAFCGGLFSVMEP